MEKGIVMEKNKKHFIVLTPDGRFLKLPRQGKDVPIGGEVEVAIRERRWGQRAGWISAAMAAVMCCIVLFGAMGWLGKEPVAAYVALDINPSVEIGIDAKEIVIEARGLNDDGRRLLSQVNYEGKTLELLTGELIARAEPYLRNEGGQVVITSTVLDESAFNEQELVDKMKRQVEETVIRQTDSGKPKDVNVTVVKVDKELREEALKNNVSPGKYAIYLKAKNAGTEISLKEFQSSSIADIAKKYDGIGKLLRARELSVKKALKEMLKQERKDKKAASKKEKSENDKMKHHPSEFLREKKNSSRLQDKEEDIRPAKGVLTDIEKFQEKNGGPDGKSPPGLWKKRENDGGNQQGSKMKPDQTSKEKQNPNERNEDRINKEDGNGNKRGTKNTGEGQRKQDENDKAKHDKEKNRDGKEDHRNINKRGEGENKGKREREKRDFEKNEAHGIGWQKST